MRRKKDVTLTDIAREVGVSTMTVSAVLNGSKSTVRVSEQTSVKVREAAKRLRYGAPKTVSIPTRRRTNSIGVLAEFIPPENMNIVLLQLIEGVLEACSASGYRPVFYPITMWDADERYVLTCCEGSVDGFVFIAPKLSQQTARHFVQSVPIISIHNAGSLVSALNLDVDSRYGAYVATKHLIDLGHRRIAHVSGSPARSGTDERMAGYRDALSDAGIPEDLGLIIQGFYNIESGVEAAHRFLSRFSPKNMPSAVFCANDASACGFVGGLRARGIRVPEDVSVIGFDDQPLAHLPVLDLTTVRQPLKSMAIYSVARLIEQIDTLAGEGGRPRDFVMINNLSNYYADIEGLRTDHETITFMPRLIVRKTTLPHTNC